MLLSEAKAVATFVIVRPVLLNVPESLLTIHDLFLPEAKAYATI